MTLADVIRSINNLADEQELPEIILDFINDAIGRINIECEANFPSFSLENQDMEFPFPEKWVRALIVPFGVGRLKQRDSSQFEYTDAYSEFQVNLDLFKSKFTIPEEYRDEESSESHAADIYERPPYPWWTF